MKKGGDRLQVRDMEFVQEYIDVKFTPEVVRMFADIILNDEWMLAVFLYISKRLKGSPSGVTVNDVTREVIINRPVKVVKGREISFETRDTEMTRHTAGKTLDKLLAMSLLTYRPVTPYKYYLLSPRGVQVLKEIANRLAE